VAIMLVEAQRWVPGGDPAMTVVGICHNATFEQSRIKVAQAQDLGVTWVRTIVYDPNGDPAHAQSWNDTIASARELKEQNVFTLVVFNTESYGGDVTDIALMASRLDDFLTQADGAVSAIEPGNELDHEDPARGIFPVPNNIIVSIGAAAAEVCHRHNVKCLSPSLLKGPEEGSFEAVATGLAGVVDAMAVHPYYCSIGGQPWDRFIFDTVEHKADICAGTDRNPGQLKTWFTEVGCPTTDFWFPTLGQPKLDEITARIGRVPTIGPEQQIAFASAVRAFQHDAIEVIFLFTLFDTAVPEEERAIGKDFGLIDIDGGEKGSLAAFRPAVTA
jgi:hypothetical protein